MMLHVLCLAQTSRGKSRLHLTETLQLLTLTQTHHSGPCDIYGHVLLGSFQTITQSLHHTKHPVYRVFFAQLQLAAGLFFFAQLGSAALKNQYKSEQLLHIIMCIV